MFPVLEVLADTAARARVLGGAVISVLDFCICYGCAAAVDMDTRIRCH